jgi:lipopolysaccharide export system permease protein
MMFTTLDRMILVSFFRSYAIVSAALLSLYVVLDLFTNIDTFGRSGNIAGITNHIVSYYSAQIVLIFDRLAESITLISAMFTVAWMQRSNELLPQLSAGIPTRRAVLPVLFGAAVTLTFGPLNQELVIPMVADRLVAPRDDLEGAKAVPLAGAYDPSGVHIEGLAGFRNQHKIVRFYATFPETLPNGQPSPSGMVHMQAEEAIYHPAEEGGEYSGGWEMLNTTPAALDGQMPPNLKMIDPGHHFLKTPDTDFDAVSRGSGWFLYAPSTKLRELLSRAEPRRQSKVAVLFHTRITRPLGGTLLVLLGLSVILQNPNRHVFISSGLCLGMSLAYYICTLSCKFLGDAGYLSPPLSAWVPLLIFGPLTLASVDAIHT